MNDEESRGPQGIEESSPEPVTEAEPQPELFTRLPLSDKDKWRPGGGLGRLPVYGCVFGVILLIGALILGISLLRRTVWMTMDRGSQQVVQSLPLNLDPAERLRTTRNLSRFRTVLESSSDPYPLMGEFLKRVRTSFDDGKFTAEEVEEINAFLEKIIEESGIPVMQLGEGIRNPPAGAERGRSRGSPASGHPLVTARHRARQGASNYPPPTPVIAEGKRGKGEKGQRGKGAEGTDHSLDSRSSMLDPQPAARAEARAYIFFRNSSVGGGFSPCEENHRCHSEERSDEESGWGKVESAWNPPPRSLVGRFAPSLGMTETAAPHPCETSRLVTSNSEFA